jgi:hypothetical protein
MPLWPSHFVEGRGELGRDLRRILQRFQKDLPIPTSERDDFMLADGDTGSFDERGDDEIREGYPLEVRRALKHGL